MANRKYTLSKERSTGDAAVDGLLAGLGAGIAAVAYLILVGLINSQNPELAIAHFDPTLGGSSLIGGLMHLAISAVYGALFAVMIFLISRLWPQILNLSWLFGAFYGLALMFLAEALFSTGLKSGLREISMLNFTAFHLIYGIVLGYIIGRSR